jgi:succinate dehydrogenase / fumarate reductase, cytochrome b subunit
VKSKRPVNLKLSTLAFPPMAIVSILHRISGIVLFLLFPFMLYLLQLSLSTRATFSRLEIMMMNPCVRLALWVFGSALIYHGIAGVRHLLSDLDWGDTLPAARWTAYSAMGLSLILILFLGMLLW